MMDHQIAAEKQYLERYLLDELSPSERDNFEAHLFDCPECAEALRTATVFEDHVRGILRVRVQRPSGAIAAGTGLPGGDAPSRIWDLFRTPWLAPAFAALLFCVVAYQNLVQIPGLRQPRAVPAFSLLPVTRGDEQILSWPQGARSVILTIDLTVPSPTGYSLEFTAESGFKWLTLRESPPPTADFLSLQLDPAQIPSGRHLLVVKSAQGGEELMRFRFVTEKP
jgi:hypothetical protein